MALLSLFNERESGILIERQAWQFIVYFDLHLGRDDSQKIIRRDIQLLKPIYLRLSLGLIKQSSVLCLILVLAPLVDQRALMDDLELSHNHVIAVLSESRPLKVSHALSGFLQEQTVGLDQHNQVS
jgi:hypothetical protein